MPFRNDDDLEQIERAMKEQSETYKIARESDKIIL